MISSTDLITVLLKTSLLQKSGLGLGNDLPNKMATSSIYENMVSLICFTIVLGICTYESK